MPAFPLPGRRSARLAAALTVLVLTSAGGRAADAAHGQDVFLTECADCHSMTAGRNKKGPTLAGVVGRKAGAISDFGKYSTALAGSGLTWTPDKLAAYVRDPRRAVPGGSMKYDGLADEKAIADLVAFLSKS